MFVRISVLAAVVALAGCTAAGQEHAPSLDAPSFAEWQQQCAGKDGRDAWLDPAPPYRVFGNTYDVGTCGITALLVQTADGYVLVDSGMPEAAPLVAANIERLGVPLSAVKWLISSHEHLDHVGATAELKRMTGAKVSALEVAKQPLETGLPYPEDPQAASIPPFEGFAVDKVLADGEPLIVGGVSITPRSTPGHTPGSTSWTWQACEGEVCHAIAYADSVSTPAADGYRFADHPDYVARIRAGIANVAQLDCDILLTPHPGASNMAERLAGSAPLIDAEACKNYSANALEQLDQLLSEETE